MTFNQCRLKGAGLLFFSLLVLLAGCGTKESSSTSTPKPPDNPPTEPTETWYVCDGTPAQCLKLADGWTLVGKVIQESYFSAPSALRLLDGRIRIYGEYDLNPLGPWNPTLVSHISDDGVQFFLEPGIRLSEGRMPNVIRLKNGEYRMYIEENTGIDLVFRSAISSDGLNFVMEPGDRLVSTKTGNEALGFTSPRVVGLKDGSYQMYYVGERSDLVKLLLSAVSADGLNWTRESDVRIYGNQFCIDSTTNPPQNQVGPLIDSGGTVHTYVGLLKCDSEGKNDQFGIFEFTSSDGLSFTWNSTPIVEGYYIKSKFNNKVSDPHLFPTQPYGVITPEGLRLYFQLREEPVTTTPIAEQGIYCLLNPNIK